MHQFTDRNADRIGINDNLTLPVFAVDLGRPGRQLDISHITQPDKQACLGGNPHIGDIVDITPRLLRHLHPDHIVLVAGSILILGRQTEEGHLHHRSGRSRLQAHLAGPYRIEFDDDFRFVLLAGIIHVGSAGNLLHSLSQRLSILRQVVQVRSAQGDLQGTHVAAARHLGNLHRQFQRGEFAQLGSQLVGDLGHRAFTFAAGNQLDPHTGFVWRLPARAEQQERPVEFGNRQDFLFDRRHQFLHLFDRSAGRRGDADAELA